MTPRDWIAVALLVLLALVAIGVGLWLLVRWLRTHDRAVREAAARHTRAEIVGIRSGVLDTEREKSDEEAWRTARDNFDR